MADLRVSVLGGLGLEVDRAEVAVRGAQRNLVVAMLAANSGALVTVSSLVDCIDPEAHHTNAVNAIQAHIRRLRSVIEPGRSPRESSKLRTVGNGYQLIPDELDLWDYRSAVRSARAIAATDPLGAIDEFSSALQLWGEPLGELGHHPAFTEFTNFLEVDHLDVQDDWVRACLEASLCNADLFAVEHGDRLGPVTVDSVVLAALEQPTREGRAAMAMQLLYLAGRQTESLKLFETVRLHLRDELGLDPGPELRQMQDRVLRHDATLLDPPEHMALRGVVRGQVQSQESTATRSLSSAIPHFETSFVGRKRLRDTVLELSRRPGVVTLCGIAGVGKTRLAAHWCANDNDSDSVVWLSVKPEDGSIVSALCAEVGLGVGTDPIGSRAAAIELLPRSRAVFVIDGAEAAMDEVIQLAVDLRTSRPELFILVTSQEPLALSGEQVVPVPPFGVPGDNDPVGGDAISLLRSLAEHCETPLGDDQLLGLARSCGGLALAIELAIAGIDTAAQPEAVGDTGKSMESASHALASAVESARVRISPPAREALDICCVLPAGLPTSMVQWWRESARPEGVEDPWEHRRVLGELVDSTLVRLVSGVSTPRHRAINQVAYSIKTSMDADRRNDASNRYLSWLMSLIGDSATALGASEVSQSHWISGSILDSSTFRLLSEESRNLDFALGYLIDSSPVAAFGLLERLMPYFRRAVGHGRGMIWADRLLDHPDLDPYSTVVSRILRGLMCPDLASVAGIYDMVVETEQMMRDLKMVDSGWWVIANLHLGIARGWTGDIPGARAAVTEAQRCAAGIPWFEAMVDRYLALQTFAEGDAPTAVDLAIGAAERFEEMGDPHEMLGSLFFVLTMGRTASVEVPQEIWDRTLELSSAYPNFYSGLIFREHASRALSEGNQESVGMLAEAVESLEAAGSLRTAACTRRDLGLLLVNNGRHAEAIGHLTRSAEMLLVLDECNASLALAGVAACVAANGLGSSDASEVGLVRSLATTSGQLMNGGGTPLTESERQQLCGVLSSVLSSASLQASNGSLEPAEPARGTQDIDVSEVVGHARELLGEVARL
ncbi:MAG: hypothetical protein KDB26_02975 [Microthrixaceae bacterium]|nr:hypothetical protein [Microthrixaceae bacterium]